MALPRLVVIVEDDDDSRMLLSMLLQGAGFECKESSSGAEGLGLIERSNPDVAIVDIGLPEMDGLEVARCLRRDPKHADLYLIALTGYAQDRDLAATREAGFDGHVVKPVDPDELVATIRAKAAYRSRVPEWASSSG